jgi:predicted nucleic acid-binding protein
MGAVSRGLLDTSVVIAHEDGIILEQQLPEEAAISVVTLAELHYGVLIAKDDQARQLRLRRLGVVEEAFQALPVDASVARAYATVAQAVKAAGRQPRARIMDLWIAATALTHGIAVYTRNAQDFEGLQELIEVRPV